MYLSSHKYKYTDTAIICRYTSSFLTYSFANNPTMFNYIPLSFSLSPLYIYTYNVYYIFVYVCILRSLVDVERFIYPYRIALS